MDETRYHQIAEECINALAALLEPYDEDGTLDVELQDGVLTIILPANKQLLISKHAASRQIWLASPISGGLHFSYNGTDWTLPNGRALNAVLAQELKALANLIVVFA